MRWKYRKENLVWTGTSMVGNVGGQLGLWVGFSFAGLLAGTLNVIPKMWDLVLRKRSSNNRRKTFTGFSIFSCSSVFSVLKWTGIKILEILFLTVLVKSHNQFSWYYVFYIQFWIVLLVAITLTIDFQTRMTNC